MHGARPPSGTSPRDDLNANPRTSREAPCNPGTSAPWWIHRNRCPLHEMSCTSRHRRDVTPSCANPPTPSARSASDRGTPNGRLEDRPMNDPYLRGSAGLDRIQPSRTRRTRHEQVVEPGRACPEITPCSFNRERHCGAGGEFRRQLRAHVGIAGADEKRGQILQRRVVTDDHRATDVAVEELQPTQQYVGAGVVEGPFRLDPGMRR